MSIDFPPSRDQPEDRSADQPVDKPDATPIPDAPASTGSVEYKGLDMGDFPFAASYVNPSEAKGFDIADTPIAEPESNPDLLPVWKQPGVRFAAGAAALGMAVGGAVYGGQVAYDAHRSPETVTVYPGDVFFEQSATDGLVDECGVVTAEKTLIMDRNSRDGEAKIDNTRLDSSFLRGADDCKAETGSDHDKSSYVTHFDDGILIPEED